MGRSADAVAAALAAVEGMTAAELAAFLDALAGSPRVAAAGWRVRERRASAERFPERNRQIRTLARRLSYAQIGRMLGMTRLAVRNIVKRARENSVNGQAAVTGPRRLP